MVADFHAVVYVLATSQLALKIYRKRLRTTVESSGFPIQTCKPNVRGFHVSNQVAVLPRAAKDDVCFQPVFL
jgi:hypothetical protein